MISQSRPSQQEPVTGRREQTNQGTARNVNLHWETSLIFFFFKNHIALSTQHLCLHLWVCVSVLTSLFSCLGRSSVEAPLEDVGPRHRPIGLPLLEMQQSQVETLKHDSQHPLCRAPTSYRAIKHWSLLLSHAVAFAQMYIIIKRTNLCSCLFDVLLFQEDQLLIINGETHLLQDVSDSCHQIISLKKN